MVLFVYVIYKDNFSLTCFIFEKKVFGDFVVVIYGCLYRNRLMINNFSLEYFNVFSNCEIQIKICYFILFTMIFFMICFNSKGVVRSSRERKEKNNNFEGLQSGQPLLSVCLSVGRNRFPF
jgi:hypothetical protein